MHQFNDMILALSQVADHLVGFVLDTHQQLEGLGCKYKVTTTKAYPYQVAYNAPGRRKGIANLYLRKTGLKMRITLTDPEKLVGAVLNTLPVSMVAQIEKKDPCRKLSHGECLPACSHLDFHIQGRHYQKCRFYCFQFDVDQESIPFLQQLLDGELALRGITCPGVKK